MQNNTKRYIYVILSLFLIVILFFSFHSNQTTEATIQNHIAILQTNEGNITIRLFDTMTPIATTRFITLANEGFYDETIIHRVFPGLALYGGQYTMDGLLKNFTEEPIELETDTTIKHIPGIISYLRTSIDDMKVGCQFIICLDNISSLDGKNSAFGIVIDGLEILEEISYYPHDDQYKDGSGRFLNPFDVVINKIIIIDEKMYHQENSN